MRLLLSILIAIGFTLVLALGIRSVLADLLALARHRPPSIFDEFPEDDPQSDVAGIRGPDSTRYLDLSPPRASRTVSNSVERRNHTS
jgi:hypothetical protein